MKLTSQKFGKMKFPDDYDVIRTVMLNKTDLKEGNNKFYLIEAHASKNRKTFRLFSCYGRVGVEGMQEERVPEQTELALLQAFESLKKEKISNRKGYTEVAMAAIKVGSDVGKTQILSNDINKDKIVSTDNKSQKTVLHDSVYRLVDRLYREAGQAVTQQLSGSLKSTTENPLGTLTLTQINRGRVILGDIHKLLTDKPKLKGTITDDLIVLSNQFFSAIPQKIPHRPKPSEGADALKTWLRNIVLNDEKRLDDKEELMSLLSDVQGMVVGFSSNDAARKYSEIGCEFIFQPNSGDEYQKVENYVRKSRSTKHDWKIDIVNIWSINVKGQKEKHNSALTDIGNMSSLFHGSRPRNILGICKHGLLMRPPGAVVTGSMFGNGLYFADQSSKSEQYSFMGDSWGLRHKSDSYFMFVADVALGKIKEYESAQMSLRQPPSGYNSVLGKKGSNLAHNEFIIYDIKQHLLRHLVEFKTNGG